MSVEDWARREANKVYPALVRGEHERYDDFEARQDEHDTAVDAHADGIVHAVDALLSDEAIAAAKLAGIRALDGAEQVEDTSGNIWDIGDAITEALQAAVRVVTEGGGNA